MSIMPEQSLTEYPNPQQWYVINAAAMPWSELRGASSSLVVFLIALPFVAGAKLLHQTVPAGRLPAEITFQAPPPGLAPDQRQRIQTLLDEFAALGFRHFTTFSVPELQNVVMYVALSPDGRAYGDVTIYPEAGLIYAECFTPFADGHSLTTISDRRMSRMGTYPEKEIRMAGPVPMAALWETHRERMEQVIPVHDGVLPGLDEQELFSHLRRDLRRYVAFQLSRRALVPVNPDPKAVRSAVE